jgi:hypothetical protein
MNVVVKTLIRPVIVWRVRGIFELLRKEPIFLLPFGAGFLKDSRGGIPGIMRCRFLPWETIPGRSMEWSCWQHPAKPIFKIYGD